MSSRLPRLAALVALLAAAGCVTPQGGASDATAAADARRCIDVPAAQADLAIHYCTRAIQAGTADDRLLATLFGKRALARLERGQLGAARADFDAATTAQPRSPTPFIGHALAAVQGGKPADAVGFLDGALERDPGLVTALVMRADMQRILGARDKALDDVESALRHEPANATALTLRGALRRQAGALDDAVRDFDAALAARPDFRAAFEQRGHVAFLRGDFAAAAADFQRSINPRSTSLNRSLWLFVAQSRIGDPEARKRLADQAGTPTARDRQAALMALVLGRISLDQALALARDPDPRVQRNRECATLFFAAQFHLWRGERATAAALFKRAAESGAEVPERDAAVAELARIDTIAPKEAEKPRAPAGRGIDGTAT